MDKEKKIKEIDNTIRRYVKRQLDKGYSKKAIKKVMAMSGYHEEFIDFVFKKVKALQSIKRHAAIISVLLLVSVFYFSSVFTSHKIPTGFAINDVKNHFNNIDNSSGNQPPHWNSDFDTFTIYQSGTLDIGQYFTDPENDNLTFNVAPIDKVKVLINNGIASFIPDLDFSGTAVTMVSAFDGTNLVTKNITLVILSEK